LQVTFDRAAALAHEHWAFLTYEHPMVREAMELLTRSDLGTSVLTVIRDGRFARGTLLLECLFVVECQAPRALEADRFLPPTLLRCLIDETGQDLGQSVPHEGLEGHCLSHNHRLARTLLEARGARLAPMVEAAERVAQQAVPRLREEAIGQMHSLLGEELERLRALSEVNPNVRPEELELLAARRSQLDRVLRMAQPRLDALRLLVTG
jgi:ATP-dependent helicase HepA